MSEGHTEGFKHFIQQATEEKHELLDQVTS